MKPPETLVPSERIAESILWIRGRRVVLDADLAALYGVATKRLNEQVKRNHLRFPNDFAFRLTRELRFSKSLPIAFTEHGALMAASVLNSPTAITVSIEVVRGFVRMRELLATHRDLLRKLQALERRYDSQFRVVFDAIRQLMLEDSKPKRRIGFGPER